MSDQPTTYDHESTALLLCAPIMFGFALLLAFLELFTHRHRGRSFYADLEAADNSRMPLLPHRKKRRSTKTRAKARWWQFWRRRNTTDIQRRLTGLHNRHLSESTGLDYGTIDGFTRSQAVALGLPLDFPNAGPQYPYKNVPSKIFADTDSFTQEYVHIRTVKCSNEGPVHLVRHRETQKQFVIKQLPCQPTKGDQPRWPIEAEIMSTLSHPNIIRLEKVDVSFPTANLVMDFCQQGDLMNYICAVKSRDEQVPAPFILHFISSMLDGLAYIHSDSGSGSIVHRDIKSQNIFLKTDEQPKFGLPTPVLADFGLARTEADNLGLPGTFRYMAPELIALRDDPTNWQKEVDPWDQIGHHTQGTDMFGFAASLFDLLAMDNGIDMTPANIITAWENSTVSDHPEILNLLLNCLSNKPAARPTADALTGMSDAFKRQLQDWYEAGGQLSADHFPNAWQFDDSEKHTSSSRQNRPPRNRTETYIPIAGRFKAMQWPVFEPSLVAV